MKANLRFILLLLKLKISRMMVFRISFFGASFADGALFLIHLLTFMVVYGHVDGIGDWGRGQMIMFVGTFSLINALNMMIYFFGVIEIPRKIKEGELDHYITKPVNPLLRITFENINPGSFPLVILSVLIILYGISVNGVPVSFAAGAAYTGLALLMTVLWYDMEVIFRSISFFFISASGIEALEGHLLTLNLKIPGVIYKGVFKVLFYFVLPYGIMSTVPTQALSGVLTPFGFLQAVGVVVFFTGFTIWFWRYGLRHYKSASS